MVRLLTSPTPAVRKRLPYSEGPQSFVPHPHSLQPAQGECGLGDPIEVNSI